MVALNVTHHSAPLAGVRWWTPSMQFLNVGGDIYNISLRGSHLLNGQQAAEEYAYALMSSMATTGVGILASASGTVWDCCFEQGAADIDGTKVDYELGFVASVTTGATAGDFTVGTPGGGSTAGAMSWALGGTALGTLACIKRVAIAREVTYHAIPRCNGVLFWYDRRGGGSYIDITLALMLDADTPEAVQAYAYSLAAAIGTEPQTLAGNGQSYTGCHLMRITVADEETRVGRIEITVRKGV